jgi:hypothetical protein
MKLWLSILLCAVALPAGLHGQHSVYFTVGTLYQDNSISMPVEDGALVQIVVSRSDFAFTAPTADSFVGDSADDVVVAQFALDGATLNGAGTGTSMVFFGNLLLPDEADAGDPLMVRWFPSLTTDSTAPGLTRYGEFRENDPGVGNADEIGFFIGAESSTLGYTFLTLSAGGGYADSLGYAAFSTAPIPEPATYALLLSSAALGSCLVARRRRHQPTRC